MKGTIFADPNAIDLSSPQGKANFIGAINHFMTRAPSYHDRVQAQVQEFVRQIREATTTSDFPANVKDAIAQFTPHDDEIDTGWLQIFDERDFTSSNKDGFKIRDTQSGLTFGVVKQGGKAKVYKVTGSEVSVSFDLYGGALEWQQVWFMDQDWWSSEDRAKEFRWAYGNDKADIHYALIEAISTDNDQAWAATSIATTDGLYQLARDIATINAACSAIAVALKNLGMGVTPQTTFKLLAPIQLMTRITRALGASFRLPNDNNSLEVTYRVEPVFTNRMTTTTDYYVCVPGRKAKAGNRMNLTVLTEFDIFAYAELAAGWGRYGAAIGEEDQFCRCKTS